MGTAPVARTGGNSGGLLGGNALGIGTGAATGLGAGVPPGAQNLGDAGGFAQSLSSAGLMQPGQNLPTVINQIIENMRPLGYKPSQGQDLSGQLRDALSQLQERSGLPKTGQLDRETLSELNRLGVVREPRHATKSSPAKDGYEVARNRDFMHEISRPRMRAHEDKGKVQSFLSLLGGLLKGVLGGRGRARGDALASKAAGAGQGADKGADARAAAPPVDPQPQRKTPLVTRGIVRSAEAAKPSEQRVQQPPPQRAKVSEQPRTQQPEQPRTPQAQQARTQADSKARPGQQATVGTSTQSAQVPGRAADTTRTTEQLRTVSMTAQQDPTGKGLPEAKGDPRAIQGQGQTVAELNARTDLGRLEAGAVREALGADGTGEEEEEEATERDRGGSSSGEESSQDPSRGHASLDDGSGEGPGHYRVPPLSHQVRSALRTITRDPGAANRATTYSWDVTLYHPAVYGAGQKAKPLFHLVVVSADAFDPVWERACAELSRHLARLEPDTPAFEMDDFQVALRQARVAEAETAAGNG